MRTSARPSSSPSSPGRGLSAPRPRGGTTAGGMVFYEDQFETGLWYGLTQYIDAFNGASGGCIQLEPGARKGRRPVSTFINTVSGLVQRRDPSGNGTLTPTAFGNSEQAAIKLFRSAPLNLTAQEWVDMGLGTEEGTQLFGEQFGVSQAQDFLNTVLAALVGSIASIGSTGYLDITGLTSKTLAFDALNNALFLFGDHRPNVRALIAHSKPMRDLIGTAFSSQQIAFQIGGTTIANGGIPSFGLIQIMTDADPLVALHGSHPTTYNSLALVPGAAIVRTGASRQQVAPIVGTATAAPENQKTRLSIEWEFEIQVKGLSYTGSTLNPNNSTLADPANWTLVASNVKLGPGIKLVTQ